MRKKLRAVEQEVLTEGMYVRFVVNLRKGSDSYLEKLIEKLKEFENVKHVEKTENDQLLFVFLVTDSDEEKRFSDVKNTITRICEILHPLDWYNIHFITSNKGSYDCHITGYFIYDSSYTIYYGSPVVEDWQYIIPDAALAGTGEFDDRYYNALRLYKYEYRRLLKTYGKDDAMSKKSNPERKKQARNSAPTTHIPIYLHFRDC